MIVEMRGIGKAYVTTAGPFEALRDVNFTADAGELVAVVGKSGSGKTTLINLVSGIDWPSAGELRVAGIDVGAMGESDRSRWRGRTVGVVFQFLQLLPSLTVSENVMLPMDFCNLVPIRERRSRALSLLDRVGVADQADKFPAALSGGQQQRAAIARALANDPPILLADEPTGNLDSANAAAVLQLFSDLATAGKAVIVATHERDIESFATRIVTIVDGAIRHD